MTGYETHYGHTNSAIILQICQTPVLPKATYGLPLCQIIAELEETLLKLEKNILEMAIGWYSKAKLE